MNRIQLPFKAAACDIDGTILWGSHLSPANRAAVRRLREAGVTVVLATGRNHHHTVNYYRELELTSPVISDDGALVAIPANNGTPMTILHQRHLPLDIAAAILEKAASKRVSCLCFCQEGISVTSKVDWSEGMERHSELGNRFRYTAPNEMADRPIYKTLLYSTNAGALNDLQLEVMGQFEGRVEYIRNSPFTLEFVANGVSKANALNIVAQHHGFKPSDALCFGDGANDVGMFGWAGFSICMHHGHERAKAAAHMTMHPTHESNNFAAAVHAVFAKYHN